MPKARVIVRDPDRAQQTVDSLRASGYEVEVTSPGDPQLSPCDLVINLGQSDPTIYSLDDAEAFFIEGDQPARREFILTPLWRKVAAFVHDRYTGLHERRSAPESNPAIASATGLPAPDPQPQPRRDYERVAAEFAAQRAQLEATFADQLAAIKEERRTQGTEILRLQQELASLRQQNEFLAQSKMEEVPDRAPVPQTSANVAKEPARLARDLKTRLQDYLARVRKLDYAKRAQEFTGAGSRRAGRAAFIAATSMRDLTMRPSFSVAAGIVFAFLLGFWAAAGKRHPEPRPAIPSVEANVSSATIVPATAEKKSATSPRAVKIQKPSPIKDAVSKKGESEFQEVVVRHYPNRGAIAKTEPPNKVKQYSDLEEDEQ